MTAEEKAAIDAEWEALEFILHLPLNQSQRCAMEYVRITATSVRHCLVVYRKALLNDLGYSPIAEAHCYGDIATIYRSLLADWIERKGRTDAAKSPGSDPKPDSQL